MFEPEERRQLYANLMEEAKGRLDALVHLLQGESRLPAPIMRESCWLQVRLLTELIALSCLVAHGDIEVPRELSRATSADGILDRLERLRPHFYPVAVTQEVLTLPDGRRNLHLTPIEPSPLSKGDLVALYGRSHANCTAAASEACVRGPH